MHAFRHAARLHSIVCSSLTHLSEGSLRAWRICNTWLRQHSLLRPVQFAALRRGNSGSVTGVGLEVGFDTSKGGGSNDLVVCFTPLGPPSLLQQAPACTQGSCTCEQDACERLHACLHRGIPRVRRPSAIMGLQRMMGPLWQLPYGPLHPLLRPRSCASAGDHPLGGRPCGARGLAAGRAHRVPLPESVQLHAAQGRGQRPGVQGAPLGHKGRCSATAGASLRMRATCPHTAVFWHGSQEPCPMWRPASLQTRGMSCKGRVGEVSLACTCSQGYASVTISHDLPSRQLGEAPVGHMPVLHGS